MKINPVIATINVLKIDKRMAKVNANVSRIDKIYKRVRKRPRLYMRNTRVHNFCKFNNKVWEMCYILTRYIYVKMFFLDYKTKKGVLLRQQNTFFIRFF